MNDSGCIRRASSIDLDEIITLERKCFEADFAYSPRQLKYLVTQAHSTCLVETDNGRIRGFIIILYRNGTTVAGVETIDVDPAFQRYKIGLRLLQAAEEDTKTRSIKKIRLEVSIKNFPAIKLYEKVGFIRVAILKNYYLFGYDGSRDALRMIKELR